MSLPVREATGGRGTQPDDRWPAGSPVIDPPAAAEPSAAPPSRWLRRMVPDAAAYLCYLALAVWACGQLWINPSRRISAHLPTDNILFYWWLTHGAHSVAHLENPLFTSHMNVPNGVNVMANTGVLGVSVPLAPITLWLGPRVSYDIYLTLALAASAGACYYVLSRYLVRSRLAAFVGAGFFGFAPGIIHHANGQPNFVTNFLLPFIVLRVFRLREPGRRLRNGVVLGLLVAWQVFINEELLLLTALGCAVAIAIYALMRRDEAKRSWRTFIQAGLIATGVALPLLAYPIWFQFAGPQHYQGVPDAFSDWGEDPTGYLTFSRDTLAGDPFVEKTIGLSEQNSWFGVPLVVLLVIMIILLWRRSLAARVSTLVMVPFALLALGPVLRWNGTKTTIPGPWRLMTDVPLIRFMYPTRMVYVIIGCVAILLALSCDLLPGIRLSGVQPPSVPVSMRALWWTAVAVALVPIVPRRMPGMDAPAVPRFIASGQWRQYVDAHHTLVSVPLPDNTIGLPALLWQAAEQERYDVPRGYFLGPNTDGTGMFGAPNRPTQQMLYKIWRTGTLPDVTDLDREVTADDLRYWRAAVVVIDVKDPRERLWTQVMTELLSTPPTLVGGMWFWDVRPIVDGTGR